MKTFTSTMNSCFMKIDCATYGLTRWWTQWSLEAREENQQCRKVIFLSTIEAQRWECGEQVFCVPSFQKQSQNISLDTPFPILDHIWKELSINLVLEMTRTQWWADSQFVVVDRFSNIVHFFLCHKTSALFHIFWFSFVKWFVYIVFLRQSLIIMTSNSSVTSG